MVSVSDPEKMSHELEVPKRNPILRCHGNLSNLWQESTPQSWRMGPTSTFVWICSCIFFTYLRLNINPWLMAGPKQPGKQHHVYIFKISKSDNIPPFIVTHSTVTPKKIEGTSATGTQGTQAPNPPRSACTFTEICRPHPMAKEQLSNLTSKRRIPSISSCFKILLWIYMDIVLNIYILI